MNTARTEVVTDKFLLGLTKRGKRWHVIGVDEKRFKNELAVYGGAVSYCDSQIVELVRDILGKPIYYSPPQNISEICTNCVKAGGFYEYRVGELNTKT